MKTIFKDGNVIDGTGSESRVVNVIVDKGRTVEIGQIRVNINGQVIGATGKIICPGFINTHTHFDLSAVINPVLSAKIRQGITIKLLGRDGVTSVPLPEEYTLARRKNIAGPDGDTDKIDWKYKNTDGYLDLLASCHPAANLAYLTPHSNARMETTGLDGHPSTREDVAKMCEVLERELKAGVLGPSAGFIYMPCAFGSTTEMIELCKVTAKYDGVFVVHQCSEADDITNSAQELIDITKATGVWLHISYMKVCDKKNWGLIDQMLGILEQAQEEGIRISFDQYSYIADSMMFGVILPPWAHSGGTDKLLERLASPELRAKMIDDTQQGISDWDNFIDFAGLDWISVTSVEMAENQDAVDLSLVQLGGLRGKDPHNATFDPFSEEENAMGMVDFYGIEEHMIKFLCRPEQNIYTDGLMGADKPHLRVSGTFPRVLGKYAHGERCLSWEVAIRKMMGKPAEVLGLQDRELLKAGYAADIVMLDLNTIADKSTFVEPNQYPGGIEIVTVSGRIALINGTESCTCSGTVIRKQYQ